MADWRRLVIFVLACAGILASLLLPWLVSDLGGLRLEVTLRKLTACVPGECRSVEAGGAYGVIGVVTFAYGWVALIGLVLGGVLPSLAGQATRGSAYGAAVLYLVLAGLAYATLDIPPTIAATLELHTHWPLWAGLGGALLALVGPPALATLERKAFVGAVPEPARRGRTTEPPLPRTRTTEPPLPRTRTTEPPLPRTRTTEPPVARGRTTAPPLPADLPLLEPLPLPPSSADARAGLRFAISVADIREDGLLAVDEEGATRELRWPEVRGVLARELQGPAPIAQAMMVDLVASGGAPLRFLTTTRLSFAGADAIDTRAALRRVLVLIRQVNGAAELEPATAAFLDHHTALPVWTKAELDRYDARYR